MPSSKASCDGSWCATVPQCLFTHARIARGSLSPRIQWLGVTVSSDPVLTQWELCGEGILSHGFVPSGFDIEAACGSIARYCLSSLKALTNMGGHRFLNEGTLERAPILLLFNRLVRCSAHECSFARLSCLLLWMPSYLHLPFSCIVSSSNIS